MPIYEIVLWLALAVVVITSSLLLIAGVLAFIGAMAMPEDINDDVLGDRYERD